MPIMSLKSRIFRRFSRTSHKMQLTLKDGEIDIGTEYQPRGAGGTRSPPAMQYHLQNPKWPPGGPKMADGVWKGVYP